jgi:long-subunit fatty acid transport protein
LFVNILVAQETAHTNFWSRIAIKQPIISKLKAEAEFQKRWQNDVTSNSNNPFDYKLLNSLRFWTYYQLNDKITFIISPFAYYENDPTIKKESDKTKISSYENRYTVALELNQKLFDKLKIQNRTGIEYRDFKNTVPDYFRCREKLSLKYNFNPKFTLIGFDEIFINTTNSNGLHNFDQNRVGIILNYKFMKEFKIEFGYMRIERSQKAISDLLNENDIVFNCYYTLPNKKIKI